MDFTRGECTFCAACADACREGALRHTADAAPWHVAAAIGEVCMARQRVVCRTCGDACEAGAIGFRPRAGGVAQPEVDASACSGCGACVGACPTAAISITPIPTESTAACAA